MILLLIILFIFGGFLIGYGVGSSKIELWKDYNDQLRIFLEETRSYFIQENQKLRNRIKMLENKKRR